MISAPRRKIGGRARTEPVMPFVIALALLLSLASFAVPSIAEAQTPRTPIVGVLSPWISSLNSASQREPFERGLRQLGWIRGATIVIEQKYADGRPPDQLAPLAAELVRMKADVIVAQGTSAIRAARQATTTIPIVMSAAGDPVREGLVQSLAHAGGNVTVTGLAFLAQGRIDPKQLELLREAIPELSRVGVLANRSSDQAVTDEINAAAVALGVRVQTFEVSRPEEIPDVSA